jgi:hypothetical protein
MNAFYEHHKSSIEFVHRCFDRILLNGLIQPFQQPERVLGFFVTVQVPACLVLDKSGRISHARVDDCENWATNCKHRWPC